MRTLVALLALLPLAAQDVPGVPRAPGPHANPRWWAAYGNDFFGNALGTSTDDYRTSQLTVGIERQGWTAAIDHSLLTDRNPRNTPPDWYRIGTSGDANPYGDREPFHRRTDEVTASVGRRWRDQQARGHAGTGIGARLRGNLGGKSLQTGTHEFLGGLPATMPYENSRLHLHPIAWLDAGWTLGRSIALAADASGLVTADDGGEHQSRVALHGLVRAPGRALWAGPALHLRGGSSDSPTADAIARGERGLWAELGASAGALSFTLGRDLESERVAGALSWTSAAEDGPQAAGIGGLRFEAGAPFGGSLDTGGGLDAQVVWIPEALRGPDWHVGAVGGYQVYRMRTPFVDEVEARWQDWTAGIEAGTRVAATGRWTVSAAFQALAGWRDATLTTIGKDPYVDHNHHSQGAVLRAGPVVRTTYDPDHGPPVGVAAFAAWVDPFDALKVPYAAFRPSGSVFGDIALNETGWMFGLRLAVHLGE